MEVKTLSKRLTEVQARRLVDVLAERLAEKQVDTLDKTLAEVSLVDTLADRLAMVKIGTVAYTLVKVEYQALVNKLSARLLKVEFDTLNHRVV